MRKGLDEQHGKDPRPARTRAAVAGLILLSLAAPLAAAGANERSAGGHRWLAPNWISAPATSVLAVAGIAGLAAHLFRRRRTDKQSRPSQTQSQTQSQRPDDDWDQRIAMWERRLSGDSKAHARPDVAPPDDPNTPKH